MFHETVVSMNMTHTDTGGYNSCVNPAENAQGRLQQTARAILAECTGGRDYFRELRGLAIRRAVYCLNRKQQVDRLPSPYEKAWGKPYAWDDTSEHILVLSVFICCILMRERSMSLGGSWAFGWVAI